MRETFPRDVTIRVSARACVRSSRATVDLVLWRGEQRVERWHVTPASARCGCLRTHSGRLRLGGVIHSHQALQAGRAPGTRGWAGAGRGAYRNDDESALDH